MGSEGGGSYCASDPVPSCPFEFDPQQNTAAAVEPQVWAAPAETLVKAWPPITVFGIKIMVFKPSFDPI
jgi:hypothetical protein